MLILSLLLGKFEKYIHTKSVLFSMLIYHFRWVLRSIDTFRVNRWWYDGSFSCSCQERILGLIFTLAIRMRKNALKFRKNIWSKSFPHWKPIVYRRLSSLPARIASVKSLTLASTAYFYKILTKGHIRSKLGVVLMKLRTRISSGTIWLIWPFRGNGLAISAPKLVPFDVHSIK